MFSLGSPSSFSVYTFLLFFGGPELGFVFCCFGGGILEPFEGLVFLIPFDGPVAFIRPLPFSVFLAASLLRTVLVGAIAWILQCC